MKNDKDKKKEKIFSLNELYLIHPGSGSAIGDLSALAGTPDLHKCVVVDPALLDTSRCVAVGHPSLLDSSKCRVACVSDIASNNLYSNLHATSGVSSYTLNENPLVFSPNGPFNYGVENNGGMVLTAENPFGSQISSLFNPSSINIAPLSSPLSKEEAETLIARYDAEHMARQNESDKRLSSIAEEVDTIKDDLEKMFSDKASEKIKKLVELEVRRYFIQQGKEMENISYASGKSMLRTNIDFIRPNSTKKGIRKGNVIFNKDTGKIFLKGRVLTQLTPGQIHYKFFECLFNLAECAVSYSLLKQTVLGENRDKTSKTDGNYCQTIKSEIKKKSKVLASLIKRFPAGDGQKGYKLNCS